MVVSGVALMAGALASSGAQAQCSGNGIQENFPFGAGDSANALTSVISTANTAFMALAPPLCRRRLQCPTSRAAAFG